MCNIKGMTNVIDICHVSYKNENEIKRKIYKRNSQIGPLRNPNSRRGGVGGGGCTGRAQSSRFRVQGFSGSRVQGTKGTEGDVERRMGKRGKGKRMEGWEYGRLDRGKGGKEGCEGGTQPINRRLEA